MGQNAYFVNGFNCVSLLLHGERWRSGRQGAAHAGGARAPSSGIAHIPAYSPEARGRSERMFGTLQDRLPKELKLAGINDMEFGETVHSREVDPPVHNARFAKAAALPQSAFVAAVRAQLRDTLCVQEERIVARDNTVAYGGLRLQLPQARCGRITSRRTCGCITIPMADWPCSTARAPSRAIPTKEFRSRPNRRKLAA